MRERTYQAKINEVLYDFENSDRKLVNILREKKISRTSYSKHMTVEQLRRHKQAVERHMRATVKLAKIKFGTDYVGD